MAQLASSCEKRNLLYKKYKRNKTVENYESFKDEACIGGGGGGGVPVSYIHGSKQESIPYPFK